MKNIALALLTLASIGCGHNEFDVSPAQVSQRTGHPAGPATPDQVHLPPGGMKFKKGDKLPDGTIADQAVMIKSDGH